jgi:hypothetical protein
MIFQLKDIRMFSIFGFDWWMFVARRIHPGERFTCLGRACYLSLRLKHVRPRPRAEKCLSLNTFFWPTNLKTSHLTGVWNRSILIQKHLSVTSHTTEKFGFLFFFCFKWYTIPPYTSNGRRNRNYIFIVTPLNKASHIVSMILYCLLFFYSYSIIKTTINTTPKCKSKSIRNDI